MTDLIVKFFLFFAGLALAVFLALQVENWRAKNIAKHVVQMKAENLRLEEQSTQVQGNYDFKADYSLTSK